MKQYRDEEGGPSIALKNTENISVGRGVKPPSLHGKHTLENKIGSSPEEVNAVSDLEDMSLSIRKAVVLDYLSGGGDGGGDNVASTQAEFMGRNPEFVVFKEPDDIYPGNVAE